MFRHQGLVKELPNYEVSAGYIINGSFSNWLPVVSGVPQESVLGPIFLFYIDNCILGTGN